LPIFRSDKAHDTTRGSSPDRGRPDPDKPRAPERRKKVRSKRRELRRKKQELREIRGEALASENWAQLTERKKKKKTIQQEIFQLEKELRAAEEGRSEDEPGTGALPDFLIIGAQKCGTTFLYHLLAQHPLVQFAASKELHFFDVHFDLGVEWYRQCFPRPVWKDGRKTITGEATPGYLFYPSVPEKMAEVVPQARLIALLRNPVERAYSHHQQATRKGKESLSFEEAIEAEEARLQGEEGRLLEEEGYASFEHQGLSYLSRGVYVDQLQRWMEFFDRDQMLVLKSEAFFDDPGRTLEPVLEFLGLPEWVPEASMLGDRRNTGSYEGGMDPLLRERLERHFEPHNRRLYDLLGADFGW